MTAPAQDREATRTAPTQSPRARHCTCDPRNPWVDCDYCTSRIEAEIDARETEGTSC